MAAADADARVALVEQEGVQDADGSMIDPGSTEVLRPLSETDDPWFDEPCSETGGEEGGQTLRAAAAGDVDADQAVEAAPTTRTSDVAVGDVTGDGRENLLFHHVWRPHARIWGTSAVDTAGDAGFAELSHVASAENDVDASGPSLVPVNVDSDGPVLRYSDGEYEGPVFNEPIVIAALAAAPCAEGVGQNVGACSTSYGDAQGAMESHENTVTVTASRYVGVKAGGDVPGGGEATAEFKRTKKLKASYVTGESDTVGTSRVFKSGPLEDAVVVTSIPYDRWVHEIVAHPDPDLVRGHENGPLTVRQGTSSEGLGIAVSEEVSEGGSLGIERTRSTDAAAGPQGVVVVAGFSIGFGAGANFTYASGTEARYDTSVGDLSAETVEEHVYAFGMFTYVQEVGDQESHVTSFWVDRARRALAALLCPLMLTTRTGRCST